LKLMFRRAHACWRAVAFGQSYRLRAPTDGHYSK
jgi:hypothetical protein